jgi:TolA-binding protein
MTQHAPLGPPPIEPLSDAAWSRVERGLWSQLDATPAPAPAPAPARAAPRRWWIAAVPLGLAAAIAAIVIGARDRAPVRDGVAALESPSRIVSGAAPAAVSFGDAHIELDAATAVATSQDAGHPTAVIERGAAWFTVAPRGPRPAFVVRSGDTRIRVIGTRFRVARAGEHSEVDVEHGRVEVQFRGSVVEIGTGERWSSTSPTQILEAGALTAPSSAAPGSAISSAAMPPPAASGSAITDSAVPGAAPPGAAPPGSAPPGPAAPGPAPETRASPRAPGVTKPRPTAPDRGPAPLPDHRSTPPARVESRAAPPAPTAMDRDRREYERLAALEPTAPEAAITGYLALARDTGPWAAPALFAAARLAADRGDRRAEALLQRYLQQFPDSPNTIDARQLLARLQAGRP